MAKKELEKADKKGVTEVNAEKEKVAALEKSNAEKDKLIDSLRELCRGVYESFRNAINAVKMLKYGKNKYKVESLSTEQERLIDSVVDYSVKWAGQDGFPDIAAEINQGVGIRKGVQGCIDERTPKVQEQAGRRKI